MKSTFRKLLTETTLVLLTAAIALAIGAKLPGLYQQWRSGTKAGDFSAHIVHKPYRLTLYGTAACPHCRDARAYLRKAGIAFNDQILDDSREAQSMYAKLNENSVPVLVSAHSMLVGFDSKQYAALIESAQR